jgi:hypothetical protein
MVIEAVVLDEASKGLLDRQLRVIPVDVDKVRKSLEELRGLLPTDSAPRDGTLQRWRLDEVQLSVELATEGGVRLVGSASVALTGCIQLTYKRVT